MKRLIAIFALVCCASAGTAQAALLIYDFSVTAVNGNLAGTSASGSFGFDDAVAPAGAKTRLTGLLSFLDFTWNGINYTEATANTGAIDRLANGDLEFVMFGTNCFEGTCAVSSRSVGWDFRGGTLNDFTYSDGQAIGFGTSTIQQRLAQVPEPATWALLGLAFALMGFTRRRRASGSTRSRR